MLSAFGIYLLINKIDHTRIQKKRFEIVIIWFVLVSRVSVVEIRASGSH